MAAWVPEWMQGVFAYASGARRSRRVSPASSGYSGAQRDQNRAVINRKRIKNVLGVQGARVRKRDSNAKSSGSKGLPGKSGAGRYDANSDEDGSSQRITAAEQSAISDEAALEPAERLDRADPKYADWTDAEIILFNQLQDRGLEPLLSISFKLDFPTLPEEVFTEDEEETFINSRKGNNLHAIRALQSLFKIGSRLRPRLLHKRHVSSILLRAINAYVKWAMEDADLQDRDLIPILSIKASRANEDHRGVISRVRNELNQLAERHRERYINSIAESSLSQGKQSVRFQHSLNNSGPRDTINGTTNAKSQGNTPPVLFGVIIVQGVMTFTALDASVENAKMQIVGIFDWAQPGQDVWNALAVAVLVMMVRNYQETLEADIMKSGEGLDDPDL